jgi:hypothetical protein
MIAFMIRSPRILRTNSTLSRGQQQTLASLRCRGSVVCVIATRGEKRHKVSADEFAGGASVVRIPDDGYRTAGVARRRTRQRRSQHLWTIPNNSPKSLLTFSSWLLRIHFPSRLGHVTSDGGPEFWLRTGRRGQYYSTRQWAVRCFDTDRRKAGYSVSPKYAAMA